MLNDTTVIAGAGLSSVAGLRPHVSSRGFFSSSAQLLRTGASLQEAISNELRKFWKAVFDYKKGRASPTFEDHFTLLDLSANTGHHLGRQLQCEAVTCDTSAQPT